MAKRGRMGVLKRQREVKKAERAAAKREKRETRPNQDEGGARVATADDLAGYGFEIEDEAGDEAD